ncbi:MAG: dihydropteroate synthase [Bacteroidia bacterium]
MKSDTTLSPPLLKCRHGQLDLSRPLVMGILNLTPDSFYDGGRYPGSDTMLAQAIRMLDEGASILDIGGASSRPGATLISPEEELNRILPAIITLREHVPGSIISVDTFHTSVAQASLHAGADLINDISGGADPSLPLLAGKEDIPYILMHMQGVPGTMQEAPVYTDVVQEVHDFFVEKVDMLSHTGVKQVILDPGFGFGKTLAHNYQLLGSLDRFRKLGYPVLAGMSRKSMISKVLHTRTADALNGTTAAHMLALMKGATLLRVHDVKEAVQTIRIYEQYKDPTLIS